MIKYFNRIQLKLVISFFILLILIPFSYAEKIDVSARVSVINNKPRIVSVIPSFSPVVLGRNNIQTFSIQINDIEWDPISYTITPQYGAVTPISWTISDSTKLQNSEAFINFTYLSTSKVWELWISKITITLNDGINSISTQEIDIYTF